MKRFKNLVLGRNRKQSKGEHHEDCGKETSTPQRETGSDSHAAAPGIDEGPQVITVKEEISTPATTTTQLSTQETREHYAIPQPYQYKPLQQPRNIRLVHLIRRQSEFDAKYKNLTLQGSFLESSLDSSDIPKYTALSYTWGNPEICEDIEIDGGTLKITINCAAALRRMLRGKAERILWVDSICINQSHAQDAMAERCTQVGMMDQIYMKALNVNVYLGEGDEKSNVACRALKALTEAYLLAKQPGPKQEEGRINYERLADDVLKTTSDYPYGKLHGVFCLPWFKRAWVVQEVALNQKVTFYCGEHLMAFWTMVIGADFTRLPYSKLDGSSAHWKMYLDYHHTLQEIVRRIGEGETISDVGLKLQVVLVGPALLFEATKPEDKVFSLYGFCKYIGIRLPDPDYTKPLAVIYTEANRAIIRQSGGLDLLSSVIGLSGERFGLPSWAMDFSGSLHRWSPSEPPHLSLQRRKNKFISRETEPNYEFQPDGRGLKLKGRRFDTISAQGRVWEIDNSTNLYGNSWRQTGQYASALVDCIGTWFDMVKEGTGSARTDEDLAVTMAHVLTDDADNGSIGPEPFQTIVRCLGVLLDRSRAKDTAWRTMLIDPLDYDIESASLNEVGNNFISPGMKGTIMALSEMMWQLVFRTTHGYLGTGNYTLQMDDLIVVFHGFATASIVRPCPGGYKYIGASYVHGIMNGEFWDRSSASEDEWFVLT